MKKWSKMGIGDFGVTFSIFAPPRSYLACVQDTGCIFGHKSIFCRKLFFDLEILIFENNQIWPFFHEKMVIFVIFGWKSKLTRSVFGVRGSYLVFRELTEYVFRESKIFDEKIFFRWNFRIFWSNFGDALRQNTHPNGQNSEPKSSSRLEKIFFHKNF